MINWIAAALGPSKRGVTSETPSPEFMLKATLRTDYAELRRLDSPLKQAFDDTGDGHYPSSPEWHLVRATLWSTLDSHQTAGLNELTRLMRDDALEPDLRAASGVLAVIAVSESDSESAYSLITEVIDLLDDRASKISRVALHLQRFICGCELANYENLQLDIDRAQRLLADREDEKFFDNPEDIAKVRDTFRESIESNKIDLYNLDIDNPYQVRFSEEKSWLWVHIAERNEIALRGYIEERFIDEVRDSSAVSRSVKFTNVDRVASSLYANFVIAQLSGHWRRFSAACALLGRERLLRKSEPPDWSREQGLMLLRRSRSHKSFESALVHVRAEGPLSALAQEFKRAYQQRGEILRRSDLHALRVGSVCASPDEATTAIRWLVSFTSKELMRDAEGSFRVSQEVWRTIGLLALRMSPEGHDFLAAAVLNAATNGDALTLNALERIVDNIKWNHVQPRVRGDWVSWALGPKNADAKSVAIAALAHLAASASDEAANALETLWEQDASTYLMAHIVDLISVGQPEPARLHAAEIERRVIELLNGMIDEAARGAHSFGGIDVGLMSAKVAVLLERNNVWPPLTDFLADSEIFASEKERALDWLAKHSKDVPTQAAKTFTTKFNVPDTLIGSKDPFESGNQSALLRFMIEFGLIGPTEAIALLLQLSGDSKHANRVDAALTAPAFRRFSNASTVALGVVLQLLQDKSVVVRNAAARQLANFASQDDGNLENLLVRKLGETLRISGLSEPLAALRGLLDISAYGRSQIVLRLESELTALARNSPSYLLREVATTVVGEDATT